MAFRLVVTADTPELVGDALQNYFVNVLGPRIGANVKRTVPVVTGDLKRSITIQVEKDGDDPVLQVGYDPHAPGLQHPPMDYGRFVEYGTSKMAGQNHLRSAIYQARGRT